MLMIAFDTNLLVRLAVNDDEEQAGIAEKLLTENEVLISRTVLLETEWVLRSVYKNSREEIALYFEDVLITENISVENTLEVSHALNWYKLGADFADAMHLCICGGSILHTFDSKFCKPAKDASVTPEFCIL